MSEVNNHSRWGVEVDPDTRHFEVMPDGLVAVELNDKKYLLKPHNFWQKFASGWEPDTRIVYESFINTGTVVVDIGGWIGPTVLFADAAGASKILVVEPNPGSFKMISENITLNPTVAAKCRVVAKAVCNENGPITIGLDDEEDDTSVCSIQGDDFTVDGITLDRLLEEAEISHIDFLKIDTEGAEILMADQLAKLADFGDPVVHLSIHVPFWPDGVRPNGLITMMKRYDIFDDRGEELSHAEISERLSSDEVKPIWGTRHGNFFELVLIPKK